VAPGTRTILAPNCPSVPVRPDLPEAGPVGSTVSFTGSLNYLSNIDAVVCLAEQVAPRLRDLVPGVRFVVTGAQPSSLVGVLERTRPGGGPEPGRHGRGHRRDGHGLSGEADRREAHKILDARELGIPVVSTSLAAEGLPVAGDPGVLVHDDPDGLAGGLAHFLQAPDRPPVRKSSSWNNALAPVAQAVAEMTSQSPTTPPEGSTGRRS
jgi:hypothetical protein